ncbi:Cox family DNA-binding protein [Proteus terrae]|uniref:Cox family DNA-binding protein n=1 Tax=Proteus terrae TaxID=1574161 RepID=UPI0025B1380C|nr:Cox family DNA-binding protein [Proteus terrae]
MNKEAINVKFPVNAVPLAKFAELIGKGYEATRSMAKAGKLPIIEFRDPMKPEARAGELWVSITEFNRGMDDAYSNLPKEQRDAWRLWVGL